MRYTDSLLLLGDSFVLTGYVLEQLGRLSGPMLLVIFGHTVLFAAHLALHAKKLA
jgi:hypothetical protein